MNNFRQILNTLESVYQDKILENILYCTYRFFDEITCDFAYSFLQKVTYDKVSENIVKDTYSDIKNTNHEFLKPEDIFIMFFSKVYNINMSDVDNFLSERGVKGTHLSTYSENDEPMAFEEMIVVFNENNEDKEKEETNLTPITFQEVDSISKSFDNPPEEFDNPPEEFDNPPEEEINNKGDKGEQYEFVNHPQHYNEWSMEVIDMMEKIYGIENTIMWCEMTAYKYAMRMGFKPTDDIQQEIDKRNWYLNKAKELKQKLN